MALPLDVRKFFGHALSLAQMGDQADNVKVLKGFGIATPKADMDIIHARLKAAEATAKELRHG